MPLFGCESVKKDSPTVFDEKRDDGRGKMPVSTSDRIEKTDDGDWRRFVGEDEEEEIRKGVPICQCGDEAFEKRPESVCDGVCVEVAEDTENIVFDGRLGGGKVGDQEMEGFLCHSSRRNAVGKSDRTGVSENLSDTLLLIGGK